MNKSVLFSKILLITAVFKHAMSDINVKIGALFEESTELELRALKLAIQHANTDSSILSADLTLTQIISNLTTGDVYMSSGSVCDVAKIGVVALVTMTSCPVETTLQSTADSLNLPILQIGKSYCGIPRISGNYFFTSRPDEEIILRALSQFLSQNRIRNIVICYQEGTDTTTIQRLVTSFAINKRYDVRTYLAAIPASIERDIVENSAVIEQIQSFAKRRDDKKIDAFLVFATPSVTVQLISKVHTSYPGSSLHKRWIIANPNIRGENLRELESATQSPVTVIRHWIDQDNQLVKRFVTAWNAEQATRCRDCTLQNTEADDIPITAYYVYDGIVHLSRALTWTLENWKGPAKLQCRQSTVTSWSGGRNLMDKISMVNSTGLLGPMSLKKSGYQISASYEILMKLSGPNEAFTKVNDWSSETSNTSSSRSLIPTIAASNRTFRVATLEEPPFVLVRKTSTGNEYSGFSIDLLDALAKQNGFKYEVYQVEDKKYGTQLPDGTWNGLVGDVIKGKADLAIAAMTITAQREKVIDFTKRYMDYSVGFVMKRPQKSANLFSFTYPFHPNVWFCIISSLILVGVVIFVLTQVSPLRHRAIQTADDSKFSIISCFWFVYSSLMQQGAELKAITWPLRVVTGFWWFFALIVVSSYTANLAAFLTVTKMQLPIRNFNDLANQKGLDYGTVVDTSIFDHIMSKGEEALNEDSVFKKMSKTVNATNNRISDAKAGFEKAESETFAFLWDVAVIEYNVINHKSCGLMMVNDRIYDKGYGIALEHGSPFRDLFSLGILGLQESGEIGRLVTKWWRNGGSCDLDLQTSENSGTELTLQNFAGVFCVLAGGLFIACVVAGLEIIYHIKKGRPYPPRNGKVLKSTSEQPEDVSRVASVESRSNEEEILVVLKKKDVMRYLEESEVHKRSTLSDNNALRSNRNSWHEGKTNGGAMADNNLVMGAVCCHQADKTMKKKSPLTEERAVLTNNHRECSQNCSPSDIGPTHRQPATKPRLVHW